MTLSCDFPLEEAVAYAAGELAGARRAVVAAHLQECAPCRERLATFAAVDRLIQEASPLRDDPVRRAALAVLLARAAGRPHRPTLAVSWQAQPRWWRTALLLLPLTMLPALLWARWGSRRSPAPRRSSSS